PGPVSRGQAAHAAVADGQTHASAVLVGSLRSEYPALLPRPGRPAGANPHRSHTLGRESATMVGRTRTQNRRDFLRVSATSSLLLPLVTLGGRTMADEARSKNARPRLGLIGAGGQGRGDARW